jgi:DNA-binding NarL/FixJ family response regulator
MINVQIVDDCKLLVECLSQKINESGIANVSAVYYDLDSCRKGLTSPLPDVLLLDVELPDGSGVDFCAEILKTYPRLKIMMLTSFATFSIAKRSLNNGALGYVLKNAMSEELLAGIEMVNSGKLFLCEEIDVLLTKKNDEEIITLTSREKEMLQHIANGEPYSIIAEKLFITETSAKTYRKRLLQKFNVNSSIELVMIAKEQKMI